MNFIQRFAVMVVARMLRDLADKDDSVVLRMDFGEREMYQLDVSKSQGRYKSLSVTRIRFEDIPELFTAGIWRYKCDSCEDCPVDMR